MKKFLSVFLVFAFVVGVCFSAPFTLKVSASSVSSLTFKLNSDGKSYCVSACSTFASGILVIPSTYNSLPVTSIGDGAFYDCTSLTSITIPDSVTSIGSSAFSGCTSLTSITIPDSVTSIGRGAFSHCTSLTSITIPDSVTSIGFSAFYNCTSLTSVNITNLAAWCNIYFGGSYANPLYYARDLYLNSELVTELQIPEGVTSIGSYAFYNCTSLTSITIPDSVTSIDYDAFYNTAYYNDTNNWENNVLYIGNHLIEAKTTLSGDYVIKSGTKCIAINAFHNCTSLTSITIPDSVTSIGSAFYNCTSLTSVNITNLAAWCNIDFSGSYANPLYYAKKLYLSHSLQKNLLIPEGVTEIKPYAFYTCKSIINIKLPKSLKKVGSDAFYDCSNIETVAISDLTAWCNIDFSGSYANPLYYAEDLYLNGKLVTELQIPEGVTSIGYYAFSGCTSLTSVTIPDSVTSIGDYAFSYCTSLTSITIPDSVTSIGDYAFSYCTSLTNITIPDSVTSIGDYAFQECTSLTSITIPDSVTSIGSSAFSGCTSLTSITIGDSVTSIGESAFGDCTSLTSITIPDSVTSIGDYAFRNCTSLTSIIIPESVTSIGEDAFSDCTSLKYVFYPGSSADWNKISIGSNNSKLTSSSIHYNTTEHSFSVVKNLPFFEGMEGSVEEICSVCGFINSSNKLLWLNDYITAVDTKNVVLDTEADMLLLDISACTDISDAIIEMDGYTITAIPNSSHGFIGTGSKLKVTTTNGTQVAEYTLVVRGDVNGDSVCDVLDCMLVELARNNQTTLEGAYYAAANLAEDDRIDTDDFNAVVNRVFA